MSWSIQVDMVTEDHGLQRHATKISTPAAGPAVEAALHELGFSDLRVGSFQITVTQEG